MTLLYVASSPVGGFSRKACCGGPSICCARWDIRVRYSRAQTSQPHSCAWECAPLFFGLAGVLLQQYSANEQYDSKFHLCPVSPPVLWGERLHGPKYDTLACGLFCTEDNQGPSDSGRAFYLPLTAYNNLEGLYKRDHTKDVLIRKAPLHLFTADICLPNMCSFYFPVNCLPHLCSPRPLPLLLSWGWHRGGTKLGLWLFIWTII